MLSIAIKEENSHFEHGLKIIISHLANQWHQEICFLPVEDIDRADIAFISLDEDWLSAALISSLELKETHWSSNVLIV